MAAVQILLAFLCISIIVAVFLLYQSDTSTTVVQINQNDPTNNTPVNNPVDTGGSSSGSSTNNPGNPSNPGDTSGGSSGVSGVDSSTPITPLVCVHGNLTSNNTCDCFDNYTGTLCDVLNCGVHGFYNNMTSSCVCTDNYTGALCQTAPLSCGINGSYNKLTNTCVCINGYTGSTCQNPPTPLVPSNIVPAPVSTPSGTVSWSGPDDTTSQGYWGKNNYGSKGHYIPGFAFKAPSYGTLTFSGTSGTPTVGNWTTNTSSACALGNPVDSTKTRVASWWQGAPLQFNISMTDGVAHKVSFFILDWNKSGVPTNFTFTDTNSGAVLASFQANGGTCGKYYHYMVKGSVNVSVDNTTSSNSNNLAGIFFD